MKTHHRHRSGSVLVLCAFMMVAMFGLIAFAVDLGYLHVVRSQLQTSADATALAATWDLIDEASLAGNGNPELTAYLARSTASQFAALNTVAGQSPALAYEDVEIGQIENPFDPAAVKEPLGP